KSVSSIQYPVSSEAPPASGTAPHAPVPPKSDEGGSRITHHASPVLGYFARMCKEKGLDTLVEAYIILRQHGRVKDLKLRIGGDGRRRAGRPTQERGVSGAHRGDGWWRLVRAGRSPGAGQRH